MLRTGYSISRSKKENCENSRTASINATNTKQIHHHPMIIPTPYSCFRIQMASLPAVILIKLSKSLTFSKRYRDLYCPRHRDPHTGDTAAHGAFCRIWRVHGLPRKKSPQRADTGGRRRSMQQCKDIRRLQS